MSDIARNRNNWIYTCRKKIFKKLQFLKLRLEIPARGISALSARKRKKKI